MAKSRRNRRMCSGRVAAAKYVSVNVFGQKFRQTIIVIYPGRATVVSALPPPKVVPLSRMRRLFLRERLVNTNRVWFGIIL